MIRELIEQLDASWQTALSGFMASREGRANLRELDALLERDRGNYFPREQDIFAALGATPFDRVRVIIIGQDPYTNLDHATGIAFFADGHSTPSLRNINTAIQKDLCGKLTNNCLKRWAEDEGVLLLNSVPTIRRAGGNNTHKGEAWETFMGAILESLVSDERILQFILWGNNAKELQKYIKGNCYHIHTAPHPTSREEHLKAFKNCRHFSTVNKIFTAKGEPRINWLPRSGICATLRALFNR